MRGPIFLGKRYYPRGTIINENRVCCRKGLPAAGSVFECGLVPQGAAEMLLRDALGF